MSSIAANWAAMNQCSEDLLCCKNLLNQYQESVNGVKRSLSFAIKLNTNIDENLDRISCRIEQMKTQLQRFSAMLSEAALNYKRTERGLLGENVEDAGEGSSVNWWKLVKKGGILGGAFSTIMDLVHSDDPAPIAVSEFLTGMLGTGGAIWEAAEKSNVNWARELTGWTDVLEGITAKDPAGIFSELFSKEFGEYTDFSTAGKSLSAVAKWAGVGVKLVSNGVENKEEYETGEITGIRAVEETVMETGVDIVVDAALYAGIGAAVAATGIGAPVVVVGALAVVAKWGIDALSKKVVGKDFTELASDLILDVAETVTNAVAEAVSEAVDTIRAVGDRIAAGWRALFSF